MVSQEPPGASASAPGRARAVMTAHVVREEARRRAGAAHDELCAELAAEATGRVAVRDDDGATLGEIVHVAPARSARVVDADAFVDWVRSHRPDAIREVADPAYTASALARAVETGEEIPGVEVRQSSGYLAIHPSYDARALVRAALDATPQLYLPDAPAPGERAAAPDITDWSPHGAAPGRNGVSESW